jgi:cleavage stimulation factor subunit 3
MDVDVPVNNTSTGDVAEDVPMTESTEATTTDNTAIDASTEQEQASVETPVQVPAEAPAQETPQAQQESPAQDQPQEEKTQEQAPQDAAQEPQETTKEPEAKESTDETPTTPLLSAPASWQIPVGALQQAPAARPDPPVNRANLRKERFESRIKENQYDIEAWTALINDSQQTGELEAIREVYENFLKVFPTSVSCCYTIYKMACN